MIPKDIFEEALLDARMNTAMKKDVKEMNEHIEDYLPYVEE